MVEVALVLPIFLLVVFGIIEFGRALMVGQLITNGARFGARQAIVDGSTNTEVEDGVKNFVASTVGVDPASVTVVIAVTPAPTNPDPADDLALTQANDLCDITVQVNYDDVSYIAGRFLKGTQLTGRCAMRHE